MALFLGAELTKMMIRMTVTESAPLRYRQGAKQWMVSWELHFGATKPLNQVLVSRLSETYSVTWAPL